MTWPHETSLSGLRTFIIGSLGMALLSAPASAVVRVVDVVKLADPTPPPQPPNLTLERALSGLFVDTGCPLPNKFKTKLRDYVNQNGSWLPDDVRNGFDPAKLQMSAGVVTSSNLPRVLHYLHVQTTPATADLLITGSDTYQTFDPTAVVDTNQPNFLYTYDCSGYLNAAASLGVSLGAADLKTAGSTALNAKVALFAAYATFFSPVAMALKSGEFPPALSLSNRDKADLLSAILQQLSDANVPDSASLTAPKELEVLWISKTGTSSFQGKADISASGHGGFGIVNISFVGGAGGAVARQVKFGDFKTYVLSDTILAQVSSSAAEARKALITAVKGASVVRAVTMINASYIVTLDLPKNVCMANVWSLAQLSENTAVGGKVTPSWSLGGCTFSALPTSGQSVITAQKGFAVTSTPIFGSTDTLRAEIHIP